MDQPSVAAAGRTGATEGDVPDEAVEAYALAWMQADRPELSPDEVVHACAVVVDKAAVRAGLAAAYPILAAQVLRNAADLLRSTAEGRREHLGQADTEHDRLLDIEVNALELAARIVAGDLEPLYGLLPVRRWTPEMHARLDAGDVSR